MTGDRAPATASTASRPRSWLTTAARTIWRDQSVVLVFLLFAAVASALSPHFLTRTNLTNVLRQVADIGIVAAGVGLGQVERAGESPRLPDEVPAACGDAARQTGHLEDAARRRRVLDAPPRHVDGSVGEVRQLDVVVLQRGVGLAAAAVDAGDDDVF